ncbi:MAG: DUF4349 domain-containing protein, partial [Chloroflexi bacterium]|nr:DUF4349 domain-containing protein [Chloroflexota bacterium]
MNAQRLFWLMAVFLTAVWMLVACGGQPEVVTVEHSVEVTRVVTETVVEEGSAVEVTRVVMQEGFVEVEAEAPPGVPSPAATAASAESAPPPQRLIIKDGRIIVIAQDTETAVNSATQLVVQLGGYIISQRVYDDDQGYRYANMRLAVPVNHFEETLRALRQLGTV